jgi:hypothetical protein
VGLEHFDELYDPYSCITNNLSESYNAVLKQENEWKELPVDMLVLGFHFLLQALRSAHSRLV